MSIERHFLGWTEPITAKVVDFLLPSKPTVHSDLTGNMVVVPTRHAGRRLAEALAIHSASFNTALLSPRIVTPAYFLDPNDEKSDTANPSEIAAIWAEVLMRSDLNKYHGLFPVRIPEQSFSQTMHLGKQIQNLRSELADSSLRLKDVITQYDNVLEEPERWQDMAKLETAYLERLAELECHDPIELMIKRAENPELASTIEHIIVAAVPDPTPLVIQTLEMLAQNVPITILIHAPEDMADRFDEWGRPIAGQWQIAKITIPTPEINIILASSPTWQSKKVIDILVSEQENLGSNDIAIGVPDSTVVSPLSAKLAENGLAINDPAGKSLNNHPLFRLIENYRDLICERSFESFSTLLRHADILKFLQSNCGMSSLQVLTQADKFQNFHLPSSIDDTIAWFNQESVSEQFPHLEKSVVFIKGLLVNHKTGSPIPALRDFLQTIYQYRILDTGTREDNEFIVVARMFKSAFEELESECISRLEIDEIHCLDLLLHRLAQEKYYPEHEKSAIDLEGWLELSWEDARLLIITGMNEGHVPNTRLSDAFLPNSLRRQLNLNHDETRVAIDIYLMRSMIESRKQTGRVCFIAGKTSAEGEPLKPSRLLFGCPDADLPQRAELLFGEAEQDRSNFPATISFQLKATPSPDFPLERIDMEKLSVSAFKDYLKCPFRFYLKHVLGMKELTDQKREMDSADFGELVHDALNAMARNERISQCEDERELAQFLQHQAKELIRQRFGNSHRLPITMQLDTARQRLNAAADVQTQLIKEGWKIIHSELKIEMQLNEMIVTGRIDRIDRHQQTGQVRIIDYKTTERAYSPETIHLGPASPNTSDWATVTLNGRKKRWMDLQLPLYLLLLPSELSSMEGIQTGYFNLPKAISDTGIYLWDEFSGELLDDARECAQGVVDSIRNRCFWPPASRVTYDDFKHLFPVDTANCVKVESFEEFMNQKT